MEWSPSEVNSRSSSQEIFRFLRNPMVHQRSLPQGQTQHPEQPLILWPVRKERIKVRSVLSEVYAHTNRKNVPSYINRLTGNDFKGFYRFYYLSQRRQWVNSIDLAEFRKKSYRNRKNPTVRLPLSGTNFTLDYRIKTVWSSDGGHCWASFEFQSRYTNSRYQQHILKFTLSSTQAFLQLFYLGTICLVGLFPIKQMQIQGRAYTEPTMT